LPNEAEALLISYVAPEFQSTCVRAGPIYEIEVASITCGPEDLPFTYTQFAQFGDMAAAYNRDLRLGPPAQPDGTCSEANYEAAYQVDGVDIGRVNCRQHESSSTGALYHDIEWTNDALLMIGYISNRADLRSWEDLITFWQEEAGPFAP
jgi:hypothetical protein